MKHNFSAGPSILPKEVFNDAAEGIIDLDGSGLSILEISHRSKKFTEILNRAQELLRELLEIPDKFEILFLTGGASTQFYMIPANILKNGEKAAYIDTGTWSSKAIKEVKYYGEADVIASSEDKNYTYIPDSWDVSTDNAYLHITSNNTIYGTQYSELPEVNVPLVIDMSSDILSYPIDFSKADLIYAGAQKNMGPAGVTTVIINKDLVGRSGRNLATMQKYETHIKKNSAFNTPPVYAIYVMMLNLLWVKRNGGVDAMKKSSRQKAALIYDAIDKSEIFTSPVREKDRSKMNAVFVMKGKDLEEEFLHECEKADIVGLKGHRSAGGFRASLYNAMPMDSVAHLVHVIERFEKKHS